MIKIYEPMITSKTKDYAKQAIDSGWISSQGEFISRASSKLSEIIGAKVVLVSNGTSATHCISRALNLKKPNIKNLIVPNNVYVAAWNCFLLDSKFDKMISVDADINTWNYDIKKLEKVLENEDHEETALLCVHNVGNIINVPRLLRKFPKLTIVGDNCEGLFGKHENFYSGTQSLCSSVSFFANKTITSGEGGALITKDEEVHEYISSFINQGNTSKKFVHNMVAQNYRMTNVQAAMLLGQLEDLEVILSKKQSIFDRYREAFSNMKNVSFQTQESGTLHSNWMMGLCIDSALDYKEIKSYLLNCGIETRPMFYCFDKHEHLVGKIKNSSNKVANLLNKKCLMIPSHPMLKDEEVNKIIDNIGKIQKKT